MANGGNSYINHSIGGNGNPTTGKLWQQLSGLGAAEMVGAAVSVGVIAFADTVAPGAMKSTTKAISKIVVEPFLDTWESGLKFFCKLKECQPDMTKSRQERAESIAHTLVVFGAALAPSLAAKIATRRGINQLCGMGDGQKWWNVFKANHDDRKVFYWDEGLHIGSALLLNTAGAKLSDGIIDTTSSVLQKTLGWDKKRSGDVATLLTVYELPNFIGLAAGGGAIVHSHMKSKQGLSHVERLAQSTSLSAAHTLAI